MEETEVCKVGAELLSVHHFWVEHSLRKYECGARESTYFSKFLRFLYRYLGRGIQD